MLTSSFKLQKSFVALIAKLDHNKYKFVCKNVTLNIENKKSIFTKEFNGKLNKDKIVVPIAHAEGNYFCDKDTLKELEENDRILFRYEDNPNGSLENIAGITNKTGNVMGMMPHPERASEEIIDGTDGRFIFESVIQSLN